MIPSFSLAIVASTGPIDRSTVYRTCKPCCLMNPDDRRSSLLADEIHDTLIGIDREPQLPARIDDPLIIFHEFHDCGLLFGLFVTMHLSQYGCLELRPRDAFLAFEFFGFGDL